MVCGRTYNLYTGTPFEGKHLRPEQVTSLLDGLAEGKSNPKLAGELGLNRTTVYYLRRELEESGVVRSDSGSIGQIRPDAKKEPTVGPNNGGRGQEGGR
jgi:transposase-like protein